MKRKVVNWSVNELFRKRDSITFPEYQRQANLWTDEKKSLLIDSILQEIDIPKLYFNRVKGDAYEVIDGQQRLWAIWGFLDREYSLIQGGRKRKFDDLSTADKKRITEYELQVTTFEDADIDYLRMLFMRLQLGLLLLTGEKLHAATGRMKDFIFGKMVKHPFIASLGIPSRRFAKETLCAQVCINSFSRTKKSEFTRTRFEDLHQFLSEYSEPVGKDLSFFNAKTAQIMHTLDQLGVAFGTRAKDLKNRSYILSVFLLFESETSNADVPTKRVKELVDFTFSLWRRLKDEAKQGMDRKNRDLYAFETVLSSAPGEKYQIARRHDRLLEFLAHFRTTQKIKGDK